MNQFTTRVELHGGVLEDYKRLKGYMLQLNFSKIVVINGVRYILPQAEYTSTSNRDEEYVASLAAKAAKATGLKYTIMVTKSAGRFFINLTQA